MRSLSHRIRSFGEAHQRKVLAERTGNKKKTKKTSLSIRTVKYLNYLSGHRPVKDGPALFTEPLPKYGSRSPMTGSSVGAADSSSNYGDNDDDDSDGDEY